MISTYEQLEQLAFDINIKLQTDFLPNGMSGYYYLNTEYDVRAVTVSNRLETIVQKTCVLAEELEHFISTPEDLFTASKQMQSKYENIARFNAVKRLIPFEKLVEAKSHRFCDIYELADHLNVTPEFLEFGLVAYKEHYGASVSYRGIVIHFDPFYIRKAC